MILFAYILPAAVIGFALGYYIGWANDAANEWLEAYLGETAWQVPMVYGPEVWR